MANDSSNPRWGNSGRVLPADRDGGWVRGNQGKGGCCLKEARQLRVGQHQERGPTESVTHADLPWTSRRWSGRGEERVPSPAQALGPSDHTGEPPWPETLSCPRNTRVRPPKGQKEKQRERRIPLKGKRGNQSPFRKGWSSLFPLGLQILNKG